MRVNERGFFAVEMQFGGAVITGIPRVRPASRRGEGPGSAQATKGLNR